MEIRSKSARIQGSSTNEHDFGFLDTADIMQGYAAAVSCMPDLCHCVLLKEKSDSSISRIIFAALPTKEWLTDIDKNKYEILDVDIFDLAKRK